MSPAEGTGSGYGKQKLYRVCGGMGYKWKVGLFKVVGLWFQFVVFVRINIVGGGGQDDRPHTSPPRQGYSKAPGVVRPNDVHGEFPGPNQSSPDQSSSTRNVQNRAKCPKDRESLLADNGRCLRGVRSQETPGHDALPLFVIQGKR